MKSMLLLSAALLLSACASNPPPSLPQQSLPLPQVVTNPPSATTEGSLTQSLTDGLSGTLLDLQQLLQVLHNASMTDLAQSLRRARVSPPPTAPAAHSP